VLSHYSRSPNDTIGGTTSGKSLHTIPKIIHHFLDFHRYHHHQDRNLDLYLGLSTCTDTRCFRGEAVEEEMATCLAFSSTLERDIIAKKTNTFISLHAKSTFGTSRRFLFLD
jgi:hypothetical protein